MPSNESWHYTKVEDEKWLGGNFHGANWYIFSRRCYELKKRERPYNLVHLCAPNSRQSLIFANEEKCICGVTVPDSVKLAADLLRNP
jgi:hypothetical protein